MIIYQFIKRKKNLVLKHINQGLTNNIKEEKKQVEENRVIDVRLNVIEKHE